MKKLSTSSHASPSSSSSSITSLEPTMCTSKSTSSGCLTSILRKILCSDGLPRDQTRELDSLDKDQNLKGKQNVETSTTSTTITTPGIVARLMGLESIEMPCGSKPNSLSRSRSMNSVDCLGEFNGMEVLHKRVKSTLSFREPPTFLLHESDKFLVLSFEGKGESREFKSSGRKREQGCEELKQKVRSERVKLSQNMKGKEVAVGEKQKRRRRKKKKTICQTENKVEVDCKSEDSSPVSVLDFERELCGTVDLSSRRKLSPKLESDQHIPVNSDDNLVIDEKKDKAIDNNNNKNEGSKKKEKKVQDYIDICSEVCRIVDDELAASNQKHIWTNKQGDLGGISADLESEIFDYLLNELVDELAGIH
uniref:DUF3741 domain-containing protein n=1 Tax=Cajanus cajan TaxID=3821 RepID=A0A151UA04_CAJCA|nr:hypothetical protein KK1_020322 [Cajanus cajan]